MNHDHITQKGVMGIITKMLVSVYYSGTTDANGYLAVTISDPAATNINMILGASARVNESDYDGRYGSKIVAIPYYDSIEKFKGLYFMGNGVSAANLGVRGHVYVCKKTIYEAT